MRNYIFAIFFFFCLLPLNLHAIAELIINENNTNYTDFAVEQLVENSEVTLDINTVQDLAFTKRSNAFSLGYPKTPVWLRFSIKNESDKALSMILELTEPFHKTVDLYTVDPEITYRSNGLKVPLSKREIKEYNPAFVLNFNPSQTKYIYLKLESTYGLFGSVQLKTPEKFHTDTRFQNSAMIFYFGSVLIIALYNLFIFFYLREKIYLYYVGHVLFFATWASLYSGIVLNSFNMQTFDLLQVSVPAFVIMLTLFSQSILETHLNFPKIHRILNAYIVLIALCIIWMLISLETGFHMMNIIATPLLPILLITSLFSSYKGHKIAKIYTLAIITYIVGMSLVSLLALGLVPYNNIIRNAPITGSLIEIVLFSLALAYRINLLRRQKLRSQAILLEHEHTESSRLAEMVEIKTAALKEANLLLEIQASTDSLTGIFNRKAFFNQCTHEVERVKRYTQKLSFIIIDIDLFKNVNDTFGHLAGDNVIINVTQEIKLQLRATDIFGRIGGEEFAILMPNTSIEHALQLAERIRNGVSNRKFIIDGNPLPVTISLGVSQYLEGEEVIQYALRRADEALYLAKDNGRNQVYSSVT